MDKQPFPLPTVQPGLVGSLLGTLRTAQRMAQRQPGVLEWHQVIVNVGWALRDLGVDETDLRPPAPVRVAALATSDETTRSTQLVLSLFPTIEEALL